MRGGQTRTSVEGGALVIAQAEARVSIDGLGTIAVRTPAQAPRGERDWMPTVIDEDMRDSIARSLRYAMATLDRLDQYARLSDTSDGEHAPSATAVLTAPR